MSVGVSEGASLLSLPAEHWNEALDHEACLVALCLVDRKLMRLAEEITAEMFVEPFWMSIFQQLASDPFASLAELTEGAKCYADRPIRTIADQIRSPINCSPRVFLWNFPWHLAEIIRLHQVRKDFERAVDFILQHSNLME